MNNKRKTVLILSAILGILTVILGLASISAYFYSIKVDPIFYYFGLFFIFVGFGAVAILRGLLPQRSVVESDFWEILSQDFDHLMDEVGDDLLTGFCRCFVHADRITSLIGFLGMSMENRGFKKSSFNRDLYTGTLFMVGTLKELVVAMGDLLGAIKKDDSHKFDLNDTPWKELKELKSSIEGNSLYGIFRNRVAFHVDKELIKEGLKKLKSEREVIIFEGNGRREQEVHLLLGLEALLLGLDMDKEAYEKFFKTVSQDFGKVSGLIQKAFLYVLEAKGNAINKVNK